MKGLPLSYNRDLQEDKLPVFDSVDTIKSCLTILDEMFPRIEFSTRRMHETAGDAFSTATDLAEYLVRKGLPFRKAHETTGKIVLYCEKKKKRLKELTLRELNKFSPLIKNDIYSVLTTEGSVKNKTSPGGTSVYEVSKQIRRLRRILDT